MFSGGARIWTVRIHAQIPVTPAIYPANDAGKNPEDSPGTPFASNEATSSRCLSRRVDPLQWIDQSTTHAQSLAVATRCHGKPEIFSRQTAPGAEAPKRSSRTRSHRPKPLYLCQPKEPEASTTTRVLRTDRPRAAPTRDKEASLLLKQARRRDRDHRTFLPSALSCMRPPLGRRDPVPLPEPIRISFR